MEDRYLLILFIHTFLMFSFSVNFFKDCYVSPAAHVKVEQAHSTVQLKLIAAMDIITI